MTDINSTLARTDIGDWPTEGNLPEQMGGARSTLLPGINTFRLPTNLAQLWHEFEAEDARQFLPNGQANPTKGQKVKRWQLKLDRNSPLVVVGGPHDGEPMTATFSTNPRPRGKKDDPKTPWISDAQYLLDVSLGDKARPKTVEELKAKINTYAGKLVKLEHGLTAQCRADKVRYIRLTVVDGSGVEVTQDLLDPTGAKGCGKRFYTKDFKVQNPQPGEPPYDTEIACACGDVSEAEAAAGKQPATVVVRAFESVERFLPAQ